MLPRYARLRKERDFRAVFASRGGSPGRQSGGRVVSTAAIVLHVGRRRGASPALLRFGFSISKKVSKRSHDRNRLKRRLSEIARTLVLPHYEGPERCDCVVVVRQGAVDADSALLRRDLLSLARRAGLRLTAASPRAQAGD